MGKRYRYPLLSKVAWWFQRYLLPDRVHAWIWLSALDELDDLHTRNVDHHDEDGSRELFKAVSEVQIENLKRKICTDHLYATLEEK